MDWQTLGQRVRTLRGRRTQKAIAGPAKISPQMVSLIEKAEVRASLETLEAVAAALGAELVIDLRDPGGSAPDPLISQIVAALPRLRRSGLRSLLVQIEALDELADLGIE